ncbi:PREDICTED: uncharacterized protein LOC108366317 [Rhagoletis zephyria]|uniref:uncharacterized protein LOC108366317 n=1 Tax=Rhagoletis zephyria TaxID=28612 RepID=UPI00081185F6|nr:PREDICTED: uncharacterized protein LOC108366317 [Rhagoletis zephyria]
MSCQQVSRLHTTAETSVSYEDQDPYVFTETVPTTPPILFNAQKSRSRVIITTTPRSTATPKQAATTTAPTAATPTQTPAKLTLITADANKRPQTPVVAANAKLKFNQKLPLGPLNGNNTKTQATSTFAAATVHNGPTAAATAKAVSPSTVKAVNSQSQKQPQQQQKNVCIVRPQQQKQQLNTTPRQQQHFKAQQRKLTSSPPPLLQHTPSLWQTPLLLDTVSAAVSPPTSPASLPSPPAVAALMPTPESSPTATTTAMVSPLITGTASTLPPSKFHHNTLAQHLQKVECIKKPKKWTSSVDGSSFKLAEQFQSLQNIQESRPVLKQHEPQQQQQPQPHFQLQRREVGTKTVVVPPTPAPQNAYTNHHTQAQSHPNKPIIATSSAPPPLQAIQAVSPPQHSDSDLNEIPVNVIFRKPQTSEILHSKLGSSISVTALSNVTGRSISDTSSTILNSKSPAVEVVKRSSSNVKPKNAKNVSSNVLPKSIPIPAGTVVTETGLLASPSLQPAPHVLRDIVFTHIGITPSKDNSTLPAQTNNTPQYHPLAAMPQQQQNMSSMAKPPPPPPPQPLKYDSPAPPLFVHKPTAGVNKMRVEEKCPQKIIDTFKGMAAVKVTTAAAKNAPKRKASGTPTVVMRSNNAVPPFIKRRGRKMGPLHSPYDNQWLASGAALIENGSIGQSKRYCKAVAVVKMSTAEIEADTTLLASATVLPYCIQKNWLYITREIQLVGGVGEVATATGKSVRNLDTLLTATSEREARIMQRKMLLQRQALQLLSTYSLQKLPMQAARRRLMCVDRLLRKYEHHGVDDIIAPKKCNYVGCSKGVLEMATLCEDHIVDNVSQHIFLPCTAKFADNTQCRIPVFDIMHDLPLCQEHARKRDAYNRSGYAQQRPGNCKFGARTTRTLSQNSLDCDAGDLLLQLKQIQYQHKQQHHHQHQQQQMHMEPNLCNAVTIGKTKKTNNVKITAVRKRKAPNVATANTGDRPQKRPRKMDMNGTPTPAPIGATLAPLQLTSAVLQRKSSTTSLESIASNSQSSNSQLHYISSNVNVPAQGKIAMPALAPLSGRNAPVLSSTISSVPAPKRQLNFSTVSRSDNSAMLSGNDVMTQDLKPHEINQLVAQFSVAVKNNNSNSNNNNNNENSNSLNAYSNNSISNCFNYISSNCDSNFTSALGSSSSLPSSTEELFRQELLSVCENSSVYASSEDTGLGGLSETELMVGPTDTDDIPLGDTRLLEEHDLANVLSALPEDAFNELFTAVHQEEREEVERALELADKHLKSLQQTIGSDIDFLGDFPDDDEILADTNAMCSKMDIVSSAMRSPDATSGIDTSTLFLDSGSNSVGGGGGSVNCSNIADIRGLVQT